MNLLLTSACLWRHVYGWMHMRPTVYARDDCGAHVRVVTGKALHARARGARTPAGTGLRYGAVALSL
jgi:hypothetical protein